MDKTLRIEEIRGCEGNCITINDTRIAGPKPWGGGYVIKRWEARVDHIIKALGVDVAEVVRCKDCKKWLKLEPSGTNCRVCADSTRIRLPYDFCSYGERKDNV